MRLSGVVFSKPNYVTPPTVSQYVMDLFLSKFSVLNGHYTDVGGLQVKHEITSCTENVRTLSCTENNVQVDRNRSFLDVKKCSTSAPYNNICSYCDRSEIYVPGIISNISIDPRSDVFPGKLIFFFNYYYINYTDLVDEHQRNIRTVFDCSRAMNITNHRN